MWSWVSFVWTDALSKITACQCPWKFVMFSSLGCARQRSISLSTLCVSEDGSGCVLLLLHFIPLISLTSLWHGGDSSIIGTEQSRISKLTCNNEHFHSVGIQKYICDHQVPKRYLRPSCIYFLTGSTLYCLLTMQTYYDHISCVIR